MHNKVIIFCSDDNYINHVKSVAANCRIQGKYDGLFGVICPRGSEAATEFKKYGFIVVEVDAIGFLQKFYVFDDGFKFFDSCLYLDCDIIVQDDLQRLFDLLDEDNIWMDTEDNTTLETFWRDTKKDEHPEVYELMNKKYPYLNKSTFNSSVIVFNPQKIEHGTSEKLFEVQSEIYVANDPENGGTDQQVINLLLWGKIKKIPNKMSIFWGCDEPQNQSYSESRGWIGDERPVILHYSRWYAQWIEKTGNMDAYYNHRLKRPCYDLYIENLAKFPELFKIV